MNWLSLFIYISTSLSTIILLFCYHRLMKMDPHTDTCSVDHFLFRCYWIDSKMISPASPHGRNLNNDLYIVQSEKPFEINNVPFDEIVSFLKK